MKPDYLSIGIRLKEARAFAKFSQQKLADIMGVSASYVKNTERGGKPSIEYLFVVADKCHVSFDWLLIGVGPSPGEPLYDQLLTQKVEAIFDSDLKDMIDVLKCIMGTDDLEQRAWAKFQFKRAFSEFCAAAEEKKHQA